MAVFDHIQTLTQHFVDTWNPLVPVIYDNGPNAAKTQSSTWARFSIVLGENLRRTLGSAPKYVQKGDIYLQIFVPKQTGLESGYTVATSFIAAFRDYRSTDFKIRAGQPEFTVMASETDWFNITLVISYQAWDA